MENNVITINGGTQMPIIVTFLEKEELHTVVSLKPMNTVENMVLDAFKGNMNMVSPEVVMLHALTKQNITKN